MGMHHSWRPLPTGGATVLRIHPPQPAESRQVQLRPAASHHVAVLLQQQQHHHHHHPASSLTLLFSSWRSMSGTAGAAPPTAVLGLGLDVGGPWHQRSRALVQTYLLTGSVLPPPPPTATAGGRPDRTPLRLPSLVSAAKGPRRRSSMARLSFSDPSLLTPNENVQFEGFSNSRRSSVLQKRPPPPPFSTSSGLLSCRTCHPSGPGQPRQQQVQISSRPTYIHFSQAIQPSSKPRPARRHSHNPTLSSEVVQGDLRPSAAQYRSSPSQGEPLSVVGKPCPLSCSQRPAAVGPTRAQLHVFLPSEAEGEEADRESVDEGFMDELDSKITSLKLQQGTKKTETHR